MARSTLADFDVECKIGSGSFGSVYRAKRKADGQTYALKEIDLRCMTAQEQEDCIKETQLLASLECEHIVRFFDSFLQKGNLYICMEYASGGNLYDFLKRQQASLPEPQVWRLFVQMLVGLHFMHTRKVLHRDFKTLNVFLDEQLNVRLGDLGVAKVLSTDTVFAQTMIGTPYYMSPEMCEDRPYNEKSDVWALGVGLYECCTRRHPFDAENQGSLILKILRGRYPPVTGYSRDLTEIVKACLTLDADKRPDTDVLLALRSVREHAASLAIQLPPLPPPLEPAGRALAASPSRRGIAAGRSFTSMRASASPSAPSAAQPAAAAPAAAAGPVGVLTPAVVVLQPPALPPPAGSRGATPPPFGRTPSSRAPSRRGLNVPKEDGADRAAAAVAAAAAAAAGAGGSAGAGALGPFVVVLPAVVGSRPVGGPKRPSVSDDAPVPGPAALEVQLQCVKIAAGGCSPRRSSVADGSAIADPGGGSGGAAAGAAAADAEGPVGTDAGDAAAAGAAASAAAGAGESGLAAASVGSAEGDLPPSSARCSSMRKALSGVRAHIVELVGPLACDALRDLFAATTAAAAAAGSSDALCDPQPQQLTAAVCGVVPAAQAPAMMALLVKMAYLEAQLEAEASSQQH